MKWTSLIWGISKYSHWSSLGGSSYPSVILSEHQKRHGLTRELVDSYYFGSKGNEIRNCDLDAPRKTKLTFRTHSRSWLLEKRGNHQSLYSKDRFRISEKCTQQPNKQLYKIVIHIRRPSLPLELWRTLVPVPKTSDIASQRQHFLKIERPTSRKVGVHLT